jgi:S-adenosylhomocysteine hydrolase
MDELQKISAEIIEIFNTKINKLSTDDAETINLCNNSMNFYMELGEREKALWEAKYTLQLLNNIVNNGK